VARSRTEDQAWLQSHPQPARPASLAGRSHRGGDAGGDPGVAQRACLRAPRKHGAANLLGAAGGDEGRSRAPLPARQSLRRRALAARPGCGDRPARDPLGQRGRSARGGNRAALSAADLRRCLHRPSRRGAGCSAATRRGPAARHPQRRAGAKGRRRPAHLRPDQDRKGSPRWDAEVPGRDVHGTPGGARWRSRRAGLPQPGGRAAAPPQHVRARVQADGPRGPAARKARPALPRSTPHLRFAADRRRSHPKAIQEHLGHKDIQTTFNVYGHLLPSAQDALAAALDTVFEAQQPDNVRPLPALTETAK
jgi:integrase